MNRGNRKGKKFVKRQCCLLFLKTVLKNNEKKENTEKYIKH